MSELIEDKPTAGRFDGTCHLLPVRVYFEDTDLSGIVYHANYLRFAERGRSDFLRMAGVHHHELATQDPPIYFTIQRLEIDFVKPARVDDELLIKTYADRVSGARLDMRQEITKDGEILARLVVKAACINDLGRPQRLPAEAREALKRLQDA